MLYHLQLSYKLFRHLQDCQVRVRFPSSCCQYSTDPTKNNVATLLKMTSERKNVVEDIIQYVRTRSPVYRKVWENLPNDVLPLEKVPLTDVDEYWNASLANHVMTAPLTDGVVMRSGGSTGAPKIVYMTHSELKAVAQVMASAIAEGCGLIAGDRIANLSHHGSMYGSFMFFNTAIYELPIPTVHLPISGNESTENIAHHMETFGATVLLSNVSTTHRIAEHYRARHQTLRSIRLILYSGESFHQDLRAIYRSAFPNATIFPVLYGSIDAGPIGVPAQPFQREDDDISPVYKVLSSLLVMEIIADDGTVIKEPEQKGSVVITHLVKKQQPIVRYPVGDIAAWVDYDEKTFRLYGRDAVGLKISSTHLPLSFLKTMVPRVLGPGVMSGFQTVARRIHGNQQAVVLRIAAQEPANAESIRQQLEEHIQSSSPSWIKNRELGNIAPLQVEWIDVKDLIYREATGKLRDIVEERV